MPSPVEIERQVIQEIGEKMAEFLKGSSPANRICGLLTAKGRSPEWEKALEHISDHFRHIPTKEKHSVFRSKFRDPDTLKEYMKRAASAPSAIRLSRETIDGRPVGTPCALIIREFKEPLGENPDELCLVIVIDHRGTLVTAIPKTKKDAGLT
jgi:hypothetical protein